MACSSCYGANANKGMLLKGVGMVIFLLWLFSFVIGGLLVLSYAYAKFIPAFSMLEPHLVNPAPRVKGIRKD